MRKILFIVFIVLISVSALTACRSTAPGAVSQGSLTLVDGLQRSVTLQQPAQRIVALAPSVSEVLFAVGAGAQLVGRHALAHYPADVTSITDIGGSMGEYSLETITRLQPDLVIAAEINTPEQVQALEQLGLNVYYLNNPANLEGLYQMIATVGQLSGHQHEADALNASLKQRVKKVEKTVAKAESTPLVFYELDGSDPAKPWTPGPGTYMDELISEAGGMNVGAVLSSAWAQISIEELLVKNPHIILLGDSIYGVTPEQVAARPGWDGLSAVQEGQVYAFNDDLVSLPGPRLVDGLEELARLLHPELYQ